VRWSNLQSANVQFYRDSTITRSSAIAQGRTTRLSVQILQLKNIPF